MCVCVCVCYNVPVCVRVCVNAPSSHVQMSSFSTAFLSVFLYIYYVCVYGYIYMYVYVYVYVCMYVLLNLRYYVSHGLYYVGRRGLRRRRDGEVRLKKTSPRLARLFRSRSVLPSSLPPSLPPSLSLPLPPSLSQEEAGLSYLEKSGFLVGRSKFGELAWSLACLEPSSSFALLGTKQP